MDYLAYESWIIWQQEARNARKMKAVEAELI
jgi:hypothetical protein